jgi:hypothetical protein
MTSPRTLAAALLTVAAAAAGCGGGGDDRLGQAEFVKRANTICARYAAESKKLAQPASIDGIPAYADRLEALFGRQLAELGGLKPPKDLERDYAALLASGKDAEKLIEDVKTAAQTKDETQIKDAGDAAAAQDKKGDALAGKLGLTACAGS